MLSALGLAVSERRRDLVESVLLSGDALTAEAVAEVVKRLAGRGREELDAPDAEVRPTYELRYGGQAFELAVEAGPSPCPRSCARASTPRTRSATATATRRAAGAGDRARGGRGPGSELEPATAGDAERRGTRSARFGDEVLEAAVLGPGTAEVEGPAVFELPGSTLVVPPGWTATADGEAVVMRA